MTKSVPELEAEREQRERRSLVVVFVCIFFAVVYILVKVYACHSVP